MTRHRSPDVNVACVQHNEERTDTVEEGVDEIKHPYRPDRTPSRHPEGARSWARV